MSEVMLHKMSKQLSNTCKLHHCMCFSSAIGKSKSGRRSPFWSPVHHSLPTAILVSQIRSLFALFFSFICFFSWPHRRHAPVCLLVDHLPLPLLSLFDLALADAARCLVMSHRNLDEVNLECKKIVFARRGALRKVFWGNHQYIESLRHI